jgi:cardiolipin synthase
MHRADTPATIQPASAATVRQWIQSGDEAFAAMVRSMDSATRSIRFETYIYASGQPGDEIREALVRAARRGVRVWVLLDAFGSLYLSDGYWDELRGAGGQFRWFNPLSLRRFNIRNHRKLLVADETRAFIGGFNVASEWLGDGLERGWRDLGLQLTGSLAVELAASFDAMFGLAEYQHRRFVRLRRTAAKRCVACPDGELLLNGPGRGFNSIKRALRQHLARAREVRVIAAYFLPPPRLRRAIARVARRGGRVQLILPAKSDVPLLQAATRSLYQRLLRAGVEIYEFEPQILHTKFLQVDASVFLGSANLDPRSLGINYDFLVRLDQPGVATEAQGIFDDYLRHSRRIELREWRQARSFWAKLRERIACFLFTRIDPWITRYQLRNFR